MKRMFVPLVLMLAISVPGCGDEDESGDTTAAAESENGTVSVMTGIDIDGEWDGILTSVAVTGECPETVEQTGEVEISKAGDDYTLVLGEGFDCDPAEVCTLEGTRSDNLFTVSVSGITDADGGQYTVNAVLNVDDSEKDAAGTMTTVYQQPDGFECIWTDNFSITRD
jgi:hypothetical protein